MGSVLFCVLRIAGSFDHMTIYPQHLPHVGIERDDTGYTAMMYSRLFTRNATSICVLCLQELEPGKNDISNLSSRAQCVVYHTAWRFSAPCLPSHVPA
jgi:hypothetical protein